MLQEKNSCDLFKLISKNTDFFSYDFSISYDIYLEKVVDDNEVC